MHFDQIAQTAAVIIGVGSLAVSGILWNIIKAYKERIEQLEDEHVLNLAKIKQLEGAVETFRDLPLKNIAETQRQMRKTQKEILNTQKEILVFIKELKA